MKPVKESSEEALLGNPEDVGSSTNDPAVKCDDYVVVLQKEMVEVPSPGSISPNNISTPLVDKKSFALGFGTGSALTAAIILLF